MVNKLMIDSGYYILVSFDTDEDFKTFKLTLGKAYQENGLFSISITDDGEYLRYFENDVQKVIRDLATTPSFEETSANYINMLLQKFPKNSIIQEIDGVYTNYFSEV